MARARTHGRSTVQPEDGTVERVRDTVGGDNAGYRPTGCNFLSPTTADTPTTPGANPSPESAQSASNTLLAIPFKSFNRLPTSVPARSSPPPAPSPSLHNSGFFRIQVSGSKVLHHRPRNGIVRPFGTVPPGFRRARVAGHRQRTRSAEGRTPEQGMINPVRNFFFFSSFINFFYFRFFPWF